MGEGYVQNYIRGVQRQLILYFLLGGFGLLVIHHAVTHYLPVDAVVATVVAAVIWACLAALLAIILGKRLAKPTEYIAQSILHIAPGEHLVAAPNLDDLQFGRELATSLTRQIYDFATVAGHSPSSNGDNKAAAGSLAVNAEQPAAILDQLPIAVIGIDEHNTVILANSRAQADSRAGNLLGQRLSDRFQLVTEDQSYGDWLTDVRQNNLTATRLWQKTELRTLEGESLGYVDIAASFNKHSASGIEVLIALYDHSRAYDNENDAISFVALAVHELRTPLTIMRGYIEGFENHSGINADPRLSEDLRKMSASAENLTSFVSQILNVARVNQGQLSLKLQSADWNQVLPEMIDRLRNRAGVYGKQIELRMEPGLPAVGLDRLTINEVITNLIDNAIKYTPDDKPLIRVISRRNGEGLVETTVQDWGVGITASVMPELFKKFQRNHRNQSQIGGTGLGLFLSKAIVTAHQGNIWVQSKEGEGSSFSFTLLPFEQLAADVQTGDNGTVVTGSHGWIKNHSMQRR